MQLKFKDNVLDTDKKCLVSINDNDYFECKFISSKNEKGKGWLVHNNSKYRGDNSPELLGYSYSWGLRFKYDDNYISYITDNIKIFNYPFKENYYIDSRLKAAISGLGHNYLLLFELNDGLYKDYSRLEYDEEIDDLLKLTKPDNSSITIKIGRFFNGLLFSKFHYLFKNEINNKLIEDITNSLLSFKKESKITFEFLSGEEILKGYNSDFYLFKNSSKLSKSCMTNKFSYLKLYTKNKSVQLATLFMNDKVICRTLVWKTDKGLFYDKIYSNIDWCDSLIKDKLKELNILPISSNIKYEVDLEKIPEQYPYLDTMCYLDKKNKKLYNYNNKESKYYLRSQYGDYEIM